MTKNEDISNPFEVTESKHLRFKASSIKISTGYMTILFFSQHYTHVYTCPKCHPILPDLVMHLHFRLPWVTAPSGLVSISRSIMLRAANFPPMSEEHLHDTAGKLIPYDNRSELMDPFFSENHIVCPSFVIGSPFHNAILHHLVLSWYSSGSGNTQVNSWVLKPGYIEFGVTRHSAIVNPAG